MTWGEGGSTNNDVIIKKTRFVILASYFPLLYELNVNFFSNTGGPRLARVSISAILAITRLFKCSNIASISAIFEKNLD